MGGGGSKGSPGGLTALMYGSFKIAGDKLYQEGVIVLTQGELQIGKYVSHRCEARLKHDDHRAGTHNHDVHPVAVLTGQHSRVRSRPSRPLRPLPQSGLRCCTAARDRDALSVYFFG